MILSIGEILADMIGSKNGEDISYHMFAGGAPFNVACYAKFSGAKVGFIGKVGKDVIGKQLIEYVNTIGLDYTDIAIDNARNTTLAIVSLDEHGERDFTFFRHDTADYNIDPDTIDFSKFEDLNIVHIGTLMLSEPKGRKTAAALVKKAKAAGKLVSLDVNFRMDLYEDFETAKAAYSSIIKKVDILKFSDDEILAYTGKDTVDAAAKEIENPSQLLCVTMGARGSMFYYQGDNLMVPATDYIVPVDTTGAGDAFFGALLSGLDGKNFELLTPPVLTALFEYANKIGGKATTKHGAIVRF